MRKAAVAMLVAVLAAAPVFADWDPAAEARDEAARKAAAAQAAQRKAEGDKARRDAEMKAARAYVGKEGQGKSDAEVKKLYDEKMAVIQRAGKGDAAARAQMQGLTPAQQAQMDSAMKGMTGKSLTDVNRMSDAELAAYQRDMEKKYGTK